MRYDEIIAQAQRSGGPDDRDEAERLVVAVVEVLGQRLAAHEPGHLAAQLPAELKHPLEQRAGDAERFDADEFVRRVAQRLGEVDATEVTEPRVRAVFSALNSAVTAGEMNDVLAQLPQDYQRLAL